MKITKLRFGRDDQPHLRGELTRRRQGAACEALPPSGVQLREGYGNVPLRYAPRGGPRQPKQPAEQATESSTGAQRQPGAEA